MSDQPKDGGPAFPTQHVAERNTILGMTLRDYFAAAAIPAAIDDGSVGTAKQAGVELGLKEGEYVAEKHWPMLFAKYCYQYADAMLSERAKP